MFISQILNTEGAVLYSQFPILSTISKIGVCMHVCDMYCVYHTCPEYFHFALAAVARPSLSHDKQSVLFSAWQILDVTAST